MNQSVFCDLKQAFRSLRAYMTTVIGLLAVLYACSGVYSISQNEIGVLQRFGRVIDDRVMPGIHFSFPWPIDTVAKIPIKSVKRISIDDFSRNYTLLVSDEYFSRRISPYCITGDNNIVNISCQFQYSISNPVKFLFRVRDPENILHQAACNAVIQCLSTLPVDTVLTYGKREMEARIKDMVQVKLDGIDCGLSISFVELKDVNPPGRIQQYFDDVINSKIDKNKMISQAESYRNENIPKANALSSRMTEQALSYREKVVLEAEGETERFLDMLESYAYARALNRKRIYLESMKVIFADIDRIYVTAGEGTRIPERLKLFLKQDDKSVVPVKER
jgi:membrane protease subunit HflK